MWNKYPPAEPEVLRLLAPQRGLIATGHSQKQDLVSYRPARVFVIGVKRTPGFVELLLPPRQSRGISLRISLPKRCARAARLQRDRPSTQQTWLRLQRTWLPW